MVPKIYYRVHESLSMGHILKQINLAHILTPKFIKTHLNNMFLFQLDLPSDLLFKFAGKIIQISQLAMSHLPSCNHLWVIRRGVT